MRILLCILMLALTVLSYGPGIVSDLASSSPHALSSSREGLYSLVKGTQDCPTAVDWIEQCAGFVLNPRINAEELETVKFCHINTGPKESRNDFGRFLTQVVEKDSYVRRIEKAVLGNERPVVREDVVILDLQREQFQWEHNHNGKGFSCLYSK